jgi:hypothetical protein
MAEFLSGKEGYVRPCIVLFYLLNKIFWGLNQSKEPKIHEII